MVSLWFLLGVVTPFVGRIYTSNYAFQIQERSRYVESELQLLIDAERSKLQRIGSEELERRSDFITDRFSDAEAIIDYRRPDALCTAFATMRVTASMFSFWYASQSRLARDDFVLGVTTEVQDQLDRVLFSPDPFWYYEKITELKSALGIEEGLSSGTSNGNRSEDDSRTVSSAYKDETIESIIGRLKEDHYRDAYSMAGEDDTKLNWIKRRAVKQLCKQFGDKEDECIDDVQELVSAMGSVAGFEELRAGTHALVFEEIDELESDVRDREGIPDDC